MQWMVKSMQALSEETRRLAINERCIYNQKHLHLHKSFVATSNPNKNGFSSLLSWRAQAYKWKKWKKWKTREIQKGRWSRSHKPCHTSNDTILSRKEYDCF